jgi:hypothetical protein
MADDASLTPGVLRQRRETAIARLCDHFAQDHIEADELERLIDQAHQATTPAELDSLLAGLPALTAPEARLPAALVDRSGAQEHQAIVAIMGGAERRGAWVPARNIYVTAVMGGAVLDFRNAQLDPGVTDIYVVALMGGVEIIVPPSVTVESNGIGIMGGFGHGSYARLPVDPTAPVLRINGVAIMGGVEIRERPHRERLRGDRDELSREERHRLEAGEPPDEADWPRRGKRGKRDR